MNDQQQRSRQRYFGFAGQPSGPVGRVVGFVAAVAAAILAFMFSLVLVALVVAGGAALGGWLWWKTREARKAMNGRRPPDGYVIEGEAVRETEAVVVRRLPE
ncbi:MAG: hypothetical protein HZT41_15845 [Dechloromonas sp.]|nr:MAG: hypothetical protein HZT41_15845 [Dechloromonas sp.]